MNTSAESNLGRGPRCSAVAHVRRIVPIGYNGAPQIRSPNYPFPWTDPQTPVPSSCLDPSDLWCQTASGSDPPFFHNALDRPTHRPTDRQRESLTTIGRSAAALRERRGLIIDLKTTFTTVLKINAATFSVLPCSTKLLTRALWSVTSLVHVNIKAIDGLFLRCADYGPVLP